MDNPSFTDPQCRRSLRRLFDKNIHFHKYCAYAICVAAVLHIGAHFFNVDRLARTTLPQVIVTSGDSPETIAFTTRAGITVRESGWWFY